MSTPPPPENDAPDIARAIVLLGFRIHNGLTEVADSIKLLANAISALSDRQLQFTLFYEGVPMGAPVTVAVGHTGTSTVVESVKATGQVVPNIGPIVYASDNTAVATIDTSGNWVAVAAGTANLSALDQGNNLTDSVALTVSAAPPPVADTMTFTLVPS